MSVGLDILSIDSQQEVPGNQASSLRYRGAVDLKKRQFIELQFIREVDE